jgi:prevent-host-death family protein
MTEVNIHEAKTHLSRLLKRVLSGEEIVIANAGKRVARIVPYREIIVDRKPGLDRGLFQVPEDFNAPLPEEVRQGFEQ